MTPRVELNKVPFNNIQPNTPVVFMTSGSRRPQYGVYRGTYTGYPVVEVRYNERKWVFDKERGRYVPGKEIKLVSRRRHLPSGLIFSITYLQKCLRDFADFANEDEMPG